MSIFELRSVKDSVHWSDPTHGAAVLPCFLWVLDKTHAPQAAHISFTHYIHAASEANADWVHRLALSARSSAQGQSRMACTSRAS